MISFILFWLAYCIAKLIFCFSIVGIFYGGAWLLQQWQDFRAKGGKL